MLAVEVDEAPVAGLRKEYRLLLERSQPHMVLGDAVAGVAQRPDQGVIAKGMECVGDPTMVFGGSTVFFHLDPCLACRSQNEVLMGPQHIAGCGELAFTTDAGNRPSRESILRVIVCALRLAQTCRDGIDIRTDRADLSLRATPYDRGIGR